MKTVFVAALAAAVLAAGAPGASAQTARLKHVAAVYADDKGAGLHQPEGVACDARGQFIVADTGNGRLVRYTFQDRKSEGGAEIRHPDLAAPTRVHLNSKGEIYALDGARRHIVRLAASGASGGALALKGVPPPATVYAKSFVIDPSDQLYVLDVFAGRVLVLAPDGTFSRALPLPADARFVTDVAIDGLGQVLLLDSVGRRLYVAPPQATAFSPLGPALDDTLITLPTALVASRGLILVVESGGSVASFGQDGTFLARQLRKGWQEGSLNHPGQACVNERDDVFVADRDNSRVQVFALAR